MENFPPYVFQSLAVLIQDCVRTYPNDPDIKRAAAFFIRRSELDVPTDALLGKSESDEDSKNGDDR